MKDTNVLVLKGLTLNGHPLASIDIAASVGSIPGATAGPVVGQSAGGQMADSSWSSNLSYGDSAYVELILPNKKVPLFKGLVSGSGITATAGGYQTASTALTTLQLSHQASALEALTLGVREYTTDAPRRKPFYNEEAGVNYSALLLHSMMYTTALRNRKLGVHIRDILHILADWYQQNAGEINVKNIVKALNIPHHKIDKLETGVVKATYKAIHGAMSSQASLWSVLLSLAEHCFLKPVPRYSDMVLIPNTPMVKFNQGLSFNQDNVTSVMTARRIPALPTTRVSIYAVRPSNYAAIPLQLPDTYVPTLDGSSIVPDIYCYPDRTGSVDSMVMFPVPEILKELMNLAITGSNESVARSAQIRPVAVAGGEDFDDLANRDFMGSPPIVQAATESKIVGQMAVKALYGAYAYQERGATITLAPGYIFSPQFSRDIKAAAQGWEEGTVYDILGKVISFQAPHADTTARLKQTMIGFVSGLSLSINTTNHTLEVILNLTHVRTRDTDNKHSITATDHPIFTTLKGKPE